MRFPPEAIVAGVIATAIAAFIAYADVWTMWPPELLFLAIEFVLVIAVGVATFLFVASMYPRS